MADVDVSRELDGLFMNFDQVILALGNTFTFEQLRCEITQQNQHAYIELLTACRQYSRPFGQAHWFISQRVQSLGYDHKNLGRVDNEHNIFGKLADKIVYTRK